MKISVIIPSYQQCAYLEETLRSVLDQRYPELELIVVDGGSQDGTVELLERFSPQLAWWVSEKDRGQTDAINKGLRRSTGEVWSYLNSDDLLAPHALARIADSFANPSVQWVGAISTIFDEHGERGQIVPEPPVRRRDYLTPWKRPMQYLFPCSNVCFMRRAILDRCGFFDETLHYSMDIEFYTRALFAGYEMVRLPEVLGQWRWHGASKTMREGSAFGFLADEITIALRYAPHLDPDERAAVLHEVAEMRKHLAVRRALYPDAAERRGEILSKLLAALPAQPGLLWFRPWLGALKRVLFGPWQTGSAPS